MTKPLDQAIARYTGLVAGHSRRVAKNEYESQEEYLAECKHIKNEKKKLMQRIKEGTKWKT